MGAPKLRLETRPDIYSYHDYRKFLGDLLAHLKSQSKDLSVNAIAKTAGVASGYIHSVLNGSLKFSKKGMDKVLPLLSLSPQEKKYFELLCLIADSESEDERVWAVNQIQKARGYQELNPKEAEVFRYLSNWYCVAIRELAALPDFQSEPEWIQSHLSHPVTLTEVKNSLEFLLEHGFLQASSDGKVKVPQKRLECLDHIYNLAIVQYHRQILSLASESMVRIDGTKRNVTGYTIAISQDKFNEIKAILDGAMKEIIRVAGDEKKPDSVYQISMIGFPLATNKEEKK